MKGPPGGGQSLERWSLHAMMSPTLTEWSLQRKQRNHPRHAEKTDSTHNSKLRKKGRRKWWWGWVPEGAQRRFDEGRKSRSRAACEESENNPGTTSPGCRNSAAPVDRRRQRRVWGRVAGRRGSADGPRCVYTSHYGQLILLSPLPFPARDSSPPF